MNMNIIDTIVDSIFATEPSFDTRKNRRKITHLFDEFKGYFGHTHPERVTDTNDTFSRGTNCTNLVESDLIDSFKNFTKIVAMRNTNFNSFYTLLYSSMGYVGHIGYFYFDYDYYDYGKFCETCYFIGRIKSTLSYAVDHHDSLNLVSYLSDVDCINIDDSVPDFKNIRQDDFDSHDSKRKQSKKNRIAMKAIKNAKKTNKRNAKKDSKSRRTNLLDM